MDNNCSFWMVTNCANSLIADNMIGNPILNGMYITSTAADDNIQFLRNTIYNPTAEGI